MLLAYNMPPTFPHIKHRYSVKQQDISGYYAYCQILHYFLSFQVVILSYFKTQLIIKEAL
ncbi:hypothetical protein BegalDRAFT_0506 [Beggiatoa alba B18LD]|uniref:Uncharacterized protein n=1 Tax=Beggiatoa alba B18LD TaxID=395493 RepID=I3CCT1_9GAMM|nr:hypothetical protein BegalDRAFT_0506 [Beggiatoa alba B18LD]